MSSGPFSDLVLEPITVIAGGDVAPNATTMVEPSFQLELRRMLLVTRALDEEMVRLQRQGQLGVYAPCRGQEAAQVGTAAALEARDWIVPSYRELGCAVARSIPVAALVPPWRGSWFSGLDPRAQRFLPISVPVGTNGLHAAGLALGNRIAGDDAVVATYFGDGATSEGDVHEAMNVASVFDLACIFVIQNNGWAISTPTRRQYAAPTLAHRAVGYGMPGWRVDGNDVLACHLAMSRAVERARAGGGPVLLELLTYRMGPHTTSDDPSRYRSTAEEARWAAADPITRFDADLAEAGLLDATVREAHAAAAHEAAEDLRAAAAGEVDPSPLEVFDHVFAQPPATYTRQRTAMAAELEAWEAST